MCVVHFKSVCPPHQTSTGLGWRHQVSQVTTRRQSPAYEGKCLAEAARLQGPEPVPGPHLLYYSRKQGSGGLACYPGLDVGQCDFAVSLHGSGHNMIKKSSGIREW